MKTSVKHFGLAIGPPT